MAKGASQVDLDRGIAGSEPAALRIGDAMRLLSMVLLRHDPRVQRAYADWLARAEAYEDVGEFTEAVAWRALFEDSVQLNALVRDLQLQRYQRWLPKMLRWEFQRALEGAPRVDVTVPDGLAWAMRGKRPKQRPGPKGFRLEHLEQHIERFYLCVVKDPPVRKKRLAIDQGCSRSDVQHSIRRAQILLACINAPLPS
jgi:hypothetical protein